MIRRYTEAELKSELAQLSVIVDTREQVNDHITGYFDKKKIPYHVRKLDTGDYSAMLGDRSLEETVAIERKRNLDEICGNFTAERERFEREFLRSKAYGIKMYLLIENATWGNVFLGNYQSKLSSASLLGSLLSWQARFNVTILFCRPEDSPKLIHGILYYTAREVLLHGW